jgi:hypothetical protein
MGGSAADSFNEQLCEKLKAFLSFFHYKMLKCFQKTDHYLAAVNDCYYSCYGKRIILFSYRASCLAGILFV